MAQFVVKASPGTDIWRKPPHTDVFNGSFSPPLSGAYSTLTRFPPPSTAPTSIAPGSGQFSGPLSSFVSATISFSLPCEEQYDQGGLLLSFRRRPVTVTEPSPPPPKWVKTGVEYYNGQRLLSTVACDHWADWSVAPLRSGSTKDAEGREWTSVAVRREGDENGTSLWVYGIVQNSPGEGAERIPLREICWVYGGDEEEWEVSVQAMAARPEKGKQEELRVEFRDFQVVWNDGDGQDSAARDDNQHVHA